MIRPPLVAVMYCGADHQHENVVFRYCKGPTVAGMSAPRRSTMTVPKRPSLTRIERIVSGRRGWKSV